MRFSSCPLISGSHWSKFLSKPAKAETISPLGVFQKQLGTCDGTYWDGAAGRRAWLCCRGWWRAQGQSPLSASSASRSSFLSGRWSRGSSGGPFLWRKEAKLDLFYEPVLVVPMIPDGDHLPLCDGRVQLPHATDVLRPLELLRVDEKDRLFDPRKGLVF